LLLLGVIEGEDATIELFVFLAVLSASNSFFKCVVSSFDTTNCFSNVSTKFLVATPSD